MKKKILMYAGIIVGLLVLSYAYVPQVLSGKIVNQSDISGVERRPPRRPDGLDGVDVRRHADRHDPRFHARRLDAENL